MDSRGTKFASLWQPVTDLRLELLPLKKDGSLTILQVWRHGGLDAWRLGGGTKFASLRVTALRVERLPLY